MMMYERIGVYGVVVARYVWLRQECRSVGWGVCLSIYLTYHKLFNFQDFGFSLSKKGWLLLLRLTQLNLAIYFILIMTDVTYVWLESDEDEAEKEKEEKAGEESVCIWPKKHNMPFKNLNEKICWFRKISSLPGKGRVREARARVYWAKQVIKKEHKWRRRKGERRRINIKLKSCGSE